MTDFQITDTDINNLFALSAFGESDNPETFFTGKPHVEGLGHIFLFRNYRPSLAKWQTADPMGYPNGWNQLAYCRNKVNHTVDFLGCDSVPGMPSPDDVANYVAMNNPEAAFADITDATDAQIDIALDTYGNVRTYEKVVFSQLKRTGRINENVGDWVQVYDDYSYYWMRTITWDEYERIYRLTRLYLIFPQGKVDLLIDDINFVTAFSPDVVGKIVNIGTSAYLYFREEEWQFLGFKYKLQSEIIKHCSEQEYYWGTRPE